MESLDDELFVDGGSVWSEGESEAGAMSLDSDLSMDTHLRPSEQTEDDDEESSEWSSQDEEESKSNDHDLTEDDWLMGSDDDDHNEPREDLEALVKRRHFEQMSLNDMIEAMWRRGSTELWDEMEERLEKDPRSARVVSHGGLLPLHYALCRREPKLSTIRALVAAYPQALTIRESESGDDSLPLHCASGSVSASPGVLRTILYANEEAVKVCDAEGQLPIHKSCGNWGNVSSVWELLSFYPEGAMEVDHCGLTPMDELMRSCRCIRLQDIPKRMPRIDEDASSYCYWAMAGDASIDMDILFWADAQLLLMAQHHGKVPPVPDSFEDDCFISVDPHGIPGLEKFRALHAAVATQSRRELIELVMTLYPDQISERDEEHGRLPLHWSCVSKNHKNFFCYPCRSMKTATTWYETKCCHGIGKPPTVCDQCYAAGLQYAVEHGMETEAGIGFKPERGEGGIWRHVPCEDILTYEKKACNFTVVEHIATSYPEAARVVDSHNRLPLHYLVDSLSQEKFPHPDGMMAVVNAHPEALEKRDPVTGLFPMDALLGNFPKDLGATETTLIVDLTYRLLRRKPDYIRQKGLVV